MNISKRIICILLSLALLLTWPGFAQQADAVALDSAALAVGLLFCSWAGVTFATNQGAATAVGNFLNSSVNGLKACTEVAAKYLVDGQLKLVQGVKDVFNSILPDINSTFRTSEGSSQGALIESFPAGIPVSLDSCISGTFIQNGNTLICNSSDGVKYFLTFTPSTGRFEGHFTRGSYTGLCFTIFPLYPSDVVSWDFTFGSKLVDDVPYRSVIVNRHFPSGYVSQDEFCFYPLSVETYIFPSSDDAIPFNRSKEIDGTQAQNALATTDLPDTVYGDDRDRSIDIGAVSGAIAAGLAGSTTQTGLSPEELIEILKKGLLFVEIPETSAPTESTDPTKDPDEDTPIAPLPPDQFNFFGDALQKVNTGLERINESVQDFKDGILPQIELFKDSVTQGFIDIGNWFSDLGEKLLDGLKSLGENITNWLKLIYDAAVEFFTKTFPQWVSDFKTWAASLKQTIIDSIKLALTELFVPSENYWDTKITTCKEAFPLFNSILVTGKGLGGFFSGLGTRPPVIYIDLGSSTSWAIGGRTIFLDLTWYSKYKPTMDNVISAFLWLLFAWRFFLKLPGLLRGEGGTIDRLNTYLEHRDK